MLSRGNRMSGKGDAWIAHVPTASAPRLRMLMFPYGGAGTAAFRAWTRLIPRDAQLGLVQLPGRESRFAERPAERIEDNADPIADALERLVADVPTVFFGHSMGALLAYEVARRLEARGARGPALLLASGHRAPHLPYPRPPVHGLSDDELLERLRELNGTPQAVLADRELLRLFLPTIRADLRACETYVHRPGPPLSCPITAYGGLSDRHVPRAALEAWAGHTRGAFTVRLFPGDHFFLHAPEPYFEQALAHDVHAVTR